MVRFFNHILFLAKWLFQVSLRYMLTVLRCQVVGDRHRGCRQFFGMWDFEGRSMFGLVEEGSAVLLVLVELDLPRTLPVKLDRPLFEYWVQFLYVPYLTKPNLTFFWLCCYFGARYRTQHLNLKLVHDSLTKRFL